jgi:hypothetical protein
VRSHGPTPQSPLTPPGKAFPQTRGPTTRGSGPGAHSRHFGMGRTGGGNAFACLQAPTKHEPRARTPCPAMHSTSTSARTLSMWAHPSHPACQRTYVYVFLPLAHAWCTQAAERALLTLAVKHITALRNADASSQAHGGEGPIASSRLRHNPFRGHRTTDWPVPHRYVHRSYHKHQQCTYVHGDSTTRHDTTICPAGADDPPIDPCAKRPTCKYR